MVSITKPKQEDVENKALQQIVELLKPYQAQYEALSPTQKKGVGGMIADIKKWGETGGLHGR